MFWLAWYRGPEYHEQHINRWSPDLVKDRGMRWIGYMFIPSHFLLAGIIAAAGYAYGGWFMATSLIVWGMPG